MDDKSCRGLLLQQLVLFVTFFLFSLRHPHSGISFISMEKKEKQKKKNMKAKSTRRDFPPFQTVTVSIILNITNTRASQHQHDDFIYHNSTSDSSVNKTNRKKNSELYIKISENFYSTSFYFVQVNIFLAISALLSQFKRQIQQIFNLKLDAQYYVKLSHRVIRIILFELNEQKRKQLEKFVSQQMYRKRFFLQATTYKFTRFERRHNKRDVHRRTNLCLLNCKKLLRSFFCGQYRWGSIF